MWHTPDGDRIVNGAEATLSKAAITAIVESIKEESSGLAQQREYGIRLYDELAWYHRLALLEQCATYLFTSTPETLQLTAVNEAAIAAVFAHAAYEIEQEIDDPHVAGTQWRKLVRTAYLACFDDPVDPDYMDDDDEDDLDVNEHRLQPWDDALEDLMDRILWDRDYEMEYLFLDAPPEQSETLKRHMGIDANYFAAAPPDSRTDERLEQIYGNLAKLTSGS